MDQKASDTIDNFYFRHPFTCMIAGPTKSGKTSIIKNIFSHFAGGLVHPCPERVLYCYAIWQPIYEDIKMSRARPAHFNTSSYYPEIFFHEGLPTVDMLDSNKNIILVLDDLMNVCSRNSEILDIFTTNSHHKNISVIYVTQNIFCNGKNSRTISLNCQYIILTNNPRDRLQVKILGKQMFPGDSEYFSESYHDAVSSKKYGYLVLDMSQETSDENRIQTGIFDENERIIYRKK